MSVPPVEPWPSIKPFCLHCSRPPPTAGVAYLPPGTPFPGLPSGKASGGKAAGGKAAAPPVCFATGGEKGVVRLWRADTGQCVYEQPAGLAAASNAAGGILELELLPGGSGLLAATQDCRLLFHAPVGADLAASRQLIGNNDEVTDMRWLTLGADSGGGGKGGDPQQQQQQQEQQPTHLAVSTNSDQIRIFDATTMSCAATLAGHTDTVLALDALRLPGVDGTAGTAGTLLASGSKDASVRVWSLPAARCIGEARCSGARRRSRMQSLCCRSSMSRVQHAVCRSEHPQQLVWQRMVACCGGAACLAPKAAALPLPLMCRRGRGTRVVGQLCGLCAARRRVPCHRRRRQAAQGKRRAGACWRCLSSC